MNMLATMYLLPSGVDQDMLDALGFDSENSPLGANGEIEKFQADNEFGVASEHLRLPPPRLPSLSINIVPRTHEELMAYLRGAPCPIPPAVVNKVCWELGLRIERLVSLLNTDREFIYFFK